MQANRERAEASMQTKVSELMAMMESKASAMEFEFAKKELHASLEELESSIQQTDMVGRILAKPPSMTAQDDSPRGLTVPQGLNALKDAVDYHADAMDAFSSDMANTVAKRISSMQKVGWNPTNPPSLPLHL